MADVEVDGVRKRFGAVRVIDGRSVVARSDRIVTLLGLGGCGKATILRSIAGLKQPDAGRIAIGGDPMYESLARTLPQPRSMGSRWSFSRTRFGHTYPSSRT